jgi:hypothetical protein
MTNSFYVTVPAGSGGGTSRTNTVQPHGINWIEVPVPTNAIAATNRLLFAVSLPVNVWFSTNLPPTTDFDLMPNTTGGFSVLTTTSTPTNIVPGGRYFLGVQNPNGVAVTYDVEVDFLLGAPATNTLSIAGIVYTNLGGMDGFLLTWFAPSNDYFQVQWTASLAPASWAVFTNIISYNVSAFTSPTNTQFNFFDDGLQSGGFGLERFYRLLLLQSTNVLTLPVQTNRAIDVLTALVVTNTATDSDTNAALSYMLITTVTGLPVPIIDATNGVITWTPATAQAGTVNTFTTIVTDNGVPPASATNSFTVTVNPLPVSIAGVTVTTNGFIGLQWSAPTNYHFQVEWTTNLASPVTWTTNAAFITSSSGAFTFVDTNASMAVKFYRLLEYP